MNNIFAASKEVQKSVHNRHKSEISAPYLCHCGSLNTTKISLVSKDKSNEIFSEESSNEHSRIQFLNLAKCASTRFRRNMFGVQILGNGGFYRNTKDPIVYVDYWA